MINTPYRKSRYSVDTAACVEWRTASSAGNTCVEVGPDWQVVNVRDTKDREGPVLAFTGAAWTSFVGWLNHG